VKKQASVAIVFKDNGCCRFVLTRLRYLHVKCEYYFDEGMLHLGNAAFSPFMVWMHDMWQKKIQPMRLKVKKYFFVE